MLSDVEVRPAGESDIPAITAIYADVVLNSTSTFELVPPEADEMAARMRKVHERGFPYFVAVQEGRVLGYAYGGPFRDRAAYDNTIEDSIYLATEARGQGIGGRLLRELIDESTALDFRQMVAVIGDSSNAASINLHKAAGFAPAGSLKDTGYKFGKWLDAVLMQRALGPGTSEKPGR